MIEELTASSAKLSQEITTLEGEVAENQEALQKATGLREKELAEFNAQESDTLSALDSLKKADEQQNQAPSGPQVPRSQ